MSIVNAAQNPHQRSLGTDLEIRLLGPMTFHRSGSAVPIASKKVRALLAYLVQREDAAIARTTLTGLLWGEREEAQARASLRQSLSELRTALGPASDALAANKESITWRSGRAWIDTKVLEAASQTEDMAVLGEAAALAKGEFLEGLSIDEPSFDHWLMGERERLRLLLARVHARLMTSAEQRGSLEEAINHGLKLLSLDPLQEPVHRTLMRLYAAQGRPDAALVQYERCERELSKELGVRPDAETEAIAKSIRAQRRETAPKAKPALSLPQKPSVAVMPFANLSSDREQDFFADAMTEEIISALSRIGELFVIARSSSFVYKNRSVRAEDAARELGVHYVLQGSVRAAGGRVRVTAQLIDGTTGGHAWSERYEGGLSDIFAVQDEITRSIAVAMQVTLTVGESVRLWEGQTRNLRAWEKMALAREGYLRFNVVENRKARGLLEEALEVDPSYTGGMVLLGLTHWWDARYDLSADVERSLARAEAQAERILEINPEMAGAFMLKGGVALLRRRHDDAVANCEKAVSLAPSDSHNMGFLGIVYRFAGQSEKAVSVLKSALRLSPHNPSWQTYHLAIAYLWTGQYTLAQSYLETYIRTEPDDPFGYLYLALVASFQGKDTEIAKALSNLRDNFPNFGPSNVTVGEPYKEVHKLDVVLAILSKAGLS